MCVCVPCLCVQFPRGQKRAPEPLELELQMVGSCHVVTGNQTQVLWTSRMCSLLLRHLSSPKIQFLPLFTGIKSIQQQWALNSDNWITLTTSEKSAIYQYLTYGQDPKWSERQIPALWFSRVPNCSSKEVLIIPGLYLGPLPPNNSQVSLSSFKVQGWGEGSLGPNTKVQTWLAWVPEPCKARLSGPHL